MVLVTCPLRQSVLESDSHALVIGGPGSGKTTLALQKALRRVASLRPGQQVLFLSFTKAAVARVVEASKLIASTRHREYLNLQTFHSLFWELLSAHSYLLGVKKRLQVLMPQDERALSGGVREDKDPLKWKAWLHERERLYCEEGRIAFDLFAPNALALLSRSDHLRRLYSQRYPLIIVDEAQDTWPDAWRSIELLAGRSQIVCLVDLDQQIFDYIPGIGPDRVAAIRSALNPLEIDLGTDNHRSPGSEIVTFGNDLLSHTVRSAPYKGVSRYVFSAKLSEPAARVRVALAILQRKVRKETGRWARTVAILVPSGREAARVSVALNSGPKPVRHKLLFDENEALLSARFASFLLEPSSAVDRLDRLATSLELLADIKSAGGSAQALRFRTWASAARQGRVSRAGLVVSLLALLDSLGAGTFTGDPARDWLSVRRALRSSKSTELAQVASHLDYIVAFSRGKRISANLVDAWQTHGAYVDARGSVDRALAQDQILEGQDDPDGLQIMNIHKAKGKQFDGVLVLRDSRHDGKHLVSNFVWWDDPHPHPRSRRILRVALTRARAHVVVVEPAWPPCPILQPYKL